MRSTEGKGEGDEFCPKCGKEVGEGNEFCSSCGTRISEISPEKAYAEARFISHILDLTILGILRILIPFLFLILRILIPDSLKYALEEIQPILFFLILNVLIPVGYFTYFFGNGQTLGMMAMKIKLVRTDGEYPIGYTRGFLRYIGMIISALVIGLGFLWILIDKNKQGWHDYIADTYVMRGGTTLRR